MGKITSQKLLLFFLADSVLKFSIEINVLINTPTTEIVHIFW